LVPAAAPLTQRRRDLAERTRSLLARFRPAVRTEWGQHFLIDEGVLETILATAALTDKDVVIEVGPGLGTLTEALLQRAGHVVAIERDRAYVRLLRQTLGQDRRLTLVEGDVLESTPSALLAAAGLGDVPYQVVANLPYGITAPTLRHFLEAGHKPTRLIVMLQREVALAITAPPGQWSLLTVSVRFYADPVLVQVVPPSAFLPPPAVHSAIVAITVRPGPPPMDPAPFFTTVRAGFAAPRQQLRNSLARGLGIAPGEAGALLELAGIDPKRRAETLSIDEWVALARAVTERGA